jgi:hypothetical protein
MAASKSSFWTSSQTKSANSSSPAARPAIVTGRTATTACAAFRQAGQHEAGVVAGRGIGIPRLVESIDPRDDRIIGRADRDSPSRHDAGGTAPRVARAASAEQSRDGSRCDGGNSDGNGESGGNESVEMLQRKTRQTWRAGVTCSRWQ